MSGDVLLVSFPNDTITRLKTDVDEDDGQIGRVQVSRHGRRPTAINY